MINTKELPVLFIHDHCFLRDSGGSIYSEGKITDHVIARYRPLSPHVTIVSRLKLTEETSELVPLSSNGLRMEPIAGLAFSRIFSSGLAYNLALMWRQIGCARFVILRLPSFLSILAAPILALRRTPYAVEIVGFSKEGLEGKGSSMLLRFLGIFMHALTKQLTLRATGALYVTQSLLQQTYPCNGIRAAVSNVELPLPPLKPGERDVKRLHNPVRLGLIGSMTTSYKGIDVAIRALAIINSKGVSCVLHVLGSGDSTPYNDLATKLGCQSKVYFDGVRKGGPGVANWLDDLDIYIQPSRTEGLPRALIEAMARGLPALASRAGGIPELLNSRWLVPIEDHNALAEGLLSLIEHPTLRRQASLSNLARAKDYDAVMLRKRRQEFFVEIAKTLT